MKKKILRSTLLILLLLPTIALAHFFVFPQETRCILIPFSGFEKRGHIYFSPGTAPDTIALLQKQLLAAKKNLTGFWGENTILKHTVIYCNNESDFNDYGLPGAPAVIHRKLGAYPVFKPESLNTSIIAHELSHGVLYNNIGWYKCTFTIPSWFDEGLAMQVDERDYYSVDTLMLKKQTGIRLPDIMTLKSSADFHSGSPEQIMLNYATSKYVVRQWLATHSLERFIRRIRAGQSFISAYNEKD
ncbi:MAG: hypothetical protein WKF88_05780 [Ferruginibacter sp.]